MSNNAPALAQNQNTLLAIVRSPKVQQEVANALPKFLTPERMVRIVCTQITQVPKLAECSPQSLIASLMRASAMGIEPDGRYGHLIPRWNSRAGVMECTFMPDYKGLILLVRRNPDVADVFADLVCENDEFEITKGLHRDIKHKIDIRKPRGPIIGVYAVIQFKTGHASFEFMQREQVDNIRARSQSPNAGPWATDYGEMAKKTVFKLLLKLADLSGDTGERLTHDVDAEFTPAGGVVIAKADVAVTAAQIEDALRPTVEHEERHAQAGAEQPKPTEAAPKVTKTRATKLPGGMEVRPPAKPAAPEENALPGGETGPGLSVADHIRKAHAGYEEKEIIAILAKAHLIDPGAKRLEEAPEMKLELALADTEGVGLALAQQREGAAV